MPERILDYFRILAHIPAQGGLGRSFQKIQRRKLPILRTDLLFLLEYLFHDRHPDFGLHVLIWILDVLGLLRNILGFNVVLKDRVGVLFNFILFFFGDFHRLHFPTDELPNESHQGEVESNDDSGKQQRRQNYGSSDPSRELDKQIGNGVTDISSSLSVLGQFKQFIIIEINMEESQDAEKSYGKTDDFGNIEKRFLAEKQNDAGCD